MKSKQLIQICLTTIGFMKFNMKFNLSVIGIHVSKYPATFTCSKLTIEIVEEDVEYVQN